MCLAVLGRLVPHRYYAQQHLGRTLLAIKHSVRWEYLISNIQYIVAKLWIILLFNKYQDIYILINFGLIHNSTLCQSYDHTIHHNSNKMMTNYYKYCFQCFKYQNCAQLMNLQQLQCTTLISNLLLTNMKNVDKQNISNKSNITYNNNQNINTLTGVVVSSGHTHTVIVPIIQGNIVHHAVIELQLGGKHVQQYFITLFKKQYQFKSKYDKQIARNIKQNIFYVALDPQKQQQQFKQPHNTKHKQYIFPSSYTKQMGEIFQSCQILFNPDLLKSIKSQQQYQYNSQPSYGIAEAIVNSIMNIQQKYHQILFNNIVLSGGNVMFQGIHERMQKQTCSILEKYGNTQKINVKVHKIAQPKYAAYIGACHYLRYYTDQVNWINKQLYATNKNIN